MSKTVEEAMFFAGAALSVLHPVARDEHLVGMLWRQRLALVSAAVVARKAGRAEGEAALRDAFYLRRSGDDPGPAGKILVAWRKLGDPAALRSQDWGPALATLFELHADDAFDRAISAATDLAAGQGSPVSAAAEIAATCLRLRPDAGLLALWLADAVLAARLKWPAPVPLLAALLPGNALGAAPRHGHDQGAWLMACCIAVARAGANAADLHADLVRRAQKLIAVAHKLRGKDADELVSRCLGEDAQAAVSGRRASERSSRRLFERLVALGAVRELTGRASFRLYGL